MPVKTNETQTIIKLYNSAGTYQRVLTEAVSDFVITKSLYGGSGPLNLSLKTKIDELESDVDFNSKIKIYRKDSYNSDPVLIYYGYITVIEPIIQEGGNEETKITCMGAISKLQNDYLRQVSNYSGSPLSYEIGPKDIDEHIKDILDHYRERINDLYASYDYSMIDDPDNYWADTDYVEDTSGIGSIPYRYFNLKHLGAIKEISKFLPKDDSSDSFWYWFLDDNGRFHLKKLSTGTDHTLYLRKHLSSLKARKNIEGVVNKVFFWNEEGQSGNQVLVVEDDSSSQNNYDIIAKHITDSQISYRDAAELYTEAELKENAEYSAEAQVRVDGNSYDILSLELGQTITIRDIQDNDVFPNRMVIKNIQLSENSAVLELSTPQPDLSTQVDMDRAYIEKQLTWFGEILTRIDGSRIQSGVQHWTQDGIDITASDYNTVTWSAGTFYLPGDVRRVIDSGSLTTASDTILYVDEENVYCGKDTGDAAEISGTGSIKVGENYLVDNSADWENDEWKGYALWVNPSGGSAEKHIISRNTNKVLYIESYNPFNTTDASCSYEVYKLELRSTTKRSASGSADSGSTTTLVDAARTEADDFWNGFKIKITSGDNAGLVRTVNDFVASSDTITFDRALPNSISNGDTYELYLSPENQIYILKAKPETDTNSFIKIESDLKTIKGSEQTGGERAQDGFTSDSYIRKVIRGSKIDFLEPEEVGLNMTQTHMGYHDGSDWQAYIQSDGTFYFGGDGSNYIQWDNSSLTVSGTINVVGGDAFSKTSDDLDDIDDGTTYGKVKTTQISAGEIVLANVSGDLDDVDDGSTYKKSTANQNTGGSRAYSGINSSGNFLGAVQPGNVAPASGSGLYLGSDYMGYYDSSNWKTYMDSSGNFYLGGTGGKLQWVAGTNSLSIEGSITISSGSGISNLSDAGDLATTDEADANVLNMTNAPAEAGADVTGDNTAKDIVNLPDTAGSAGLYATGTYLGYYDGSDWQAYIENNGDFYFRGDASNYIQWNGSTLTVRGSINADDINAGTLTGRKVRTSSGSTRVEMNDGDNALYVYYDGDKRIDINQDRIVFNSDSGGSGVGSLWCSSDGIDFYAHSYSGSDIAQMVFYATGSTTGELRPMFGSTINLGNSSYGFDNLYINDIYAGGTYVELRDTVDMNGYDIRNVDKLYVDEIYFDGSPYKIYGAYTSIEFETSASSSGGMTIDGGINGVKIDSIMYATAQVQVDQDAFDTDDDNYSFVVSNNSSVAQAGYGYADFWDTYSEYVEVEKVAQEYMNITEKEAKEKILSKVKKRALLKSESKRKDPVRFTGLSSKDKEDVIQKKIDKINKRDWSNTVDLFYEKERYSSLDEGTVLAFSDDGAIPTKEVGQTNVMGVISTNPCITAHADEKGIKVTKFGRTFAKVIGKCSVGDILWTSDEEGCLEKAVNPSAGQIVARARVTKNTEEVEKIEVDLTL